MSKKTLNAENLTNLGAVKLAELLIEISTGSAEIKRRLRLELTHALGPKELGQEVRKRLATIKRSKSYVDWHKRKALIADLDTQLTMITDKIAQADPALAFELLWQFVGLAGSVYERVDDSSGDVGDVFRYAITRFENISSEVQLDPSSLAQKVFEAVADNGYGQYDDLIRYVGPALGKIGLESLKTIVLRYGATPLADEPTTDTNVVPISKQYYTYKPDPGFREQAKERLVAQCMREIADQLGDVDAYMAQYSSDDLLNPHWAANVATRLLNADRAVEAINILTAARDAEKFRHIPSEWDSAFITALDMLGQSENLRAFRWQRFQETLSIPHLRDLLKTLPDFDDVDTEDRAKTWAMQHPSVHTALQFFLEWPDFPLASELILARSDDLDGNQYHILTPAADQLQGRFSLAAVMARRAMILHTLEKAKTSRYKHAIRHYLECQSADKEISDYGRFPTHVEFSEQLRAGHARKTSFWDNIY